MRAAMLMMALVTAFGLSACNSATSRAPSPVLAAVRLNQPSDAMPLSRAKIDFATQLKPIFESRCQPCHFSGGKVYQRMPFDRQETIKALGSKLFTRIKDEKEQNLIREFLAQ